MERQGLLAFVEKLGIRCWKDHPATLYGDYDENGTYVVDPRDGKIYLPLIKKGALVEVKPDEETPVAFAEGYLEEATEETKELSGHFPYHSGRCPRFR